ncbi:MAG TPA: cation-translocating P-type ATPase [Planctomycetota bacterium]|nr:cation-translocating P-type ATPase [Planctomycetota bacterium]
MAGLSSHRSAGKDGERTTVLVVGGLDDTDSVRRAEAALRALTGVESAGVNLLTRLSTVRHSAQVIPSDLVKAVDAAGFRATLANSGEESDGCGLIETLELIASRKSRFYAGALLTALIFIVESANTNASWKLMTMFMLAAPVQIAVGWEFYASFFKALRRWRFNLDSLVVLASTAAFAQGALCFLGQATADPDLSRWNPQFHTAALILTAVSLGKWLESMARDSADELWGGIEALLPRDACVLRDGREMIIPAGAVAVGDIVLVAPGERVPVDGEVLEGCTHIDESPLTGDARPVSKVVGDHVVVASLNGSGFIHVRAMGVGPHSTLAHISMLIERAREKKGSSEVLADRIAAALVPIAILLACGTFCFWYFGPSVLGRLIGTASRWIDVHRFGPNATVEAFLLSNPSFTEALRPAISVLIAACPIALGLATPMAVLLATRFAARRGMLIKGGGALEAAARVTDVVFDQSGTLTCGVFRVRECFGAPEINRDSVLAIAAALGSRTRQDAAKCIDREARRRGIAVPIPERCELLAGGGVGGRLGATEFRLYPRNYVLNSGIAVHPSLAARAAEAETAGSAVLYLCRENDALGAIALEERIKDGAVDAIAMLREKGFAVHLISGESLAQTRTVGKACGLYETEIHGLASSEGKAEFARELRAAGRGVAVIGDGASDAPAMAAADVGIALGAGAEPALDSAQIVLVSGDARGVPALLDLAGAAARIIRQNLVVSLSFTAVMLPLALCNRVIPTVGALIMGLSSVLVVLNSMRLALRERKVKLALPAAVDAPMPAHAVTR